MEKIDTQYFESMIDAYADLEIGKRYAEFIKMANYINAQIDKENNSLNIKERVKTSEEIKNCPFCNIKPLSGFTINNKFFIICSSEKCGISPRSGVRKTKEEAIDAWNTRKGCDNDK